MARLLKVAPIAVAVCALSVFIACKSRGFNNKSGVRNTAGATPATLLSGVPTVMLQGITSQSSSRDIIIVDDKNAKLNVFSFTGAAFKNADSGESVDVQTLSGYYGRAFRASKPETCNLIGRVLGGKDLITDDKQKCIFELHSTDKVVITAAKATADAPAGDYWGVTVSVIAVDDSGEGFVSSGDFKNSIPAGPQVLADGLTPTGTSKMIRTTKAPVKDSSGAVVKDASGNPVVTEVVLPNPNATIDEAAVSKAMVVAYNKYVKASGETSERNSCLMNYRAKDWTDISAHYYCIFSHSFRECYSTQLVVSKEKAYGEVVANPLIAPDQRNSAMLTRLPGLHQAAWNQCMDSSSASAEGKWIKANQENVFKYVMMTSTGVIDFNVESEQKVINDFYKTVGETRPRRFTDSFSAWAPDQPRYDVVRQTQQAMIARLKAAAAAAAAAAGGSSPATAPAAPAAPAASGSSGQ